MANYINKYENATAYDADKAKQYPNVSYVEETDEIVWLKNGDYSKDYLTFVALEDTTFKFRGNTVNYSLDDGQTWTSLPSNTDTPTIASGNKILWKANLIRDDFNGLGIFSSSGRFSVEGNAMSLVSGDSFANATVIPQTSQFRNLFSGNTNIVSAENLILPATTLASSYYNAMFQGCTSLTTAPKLPATTLASWCYYGMFSGCTNLNSVTCLATNISATNCTKDWVSGVAATGTFTKAAGTTWTTGASGIPDGWTVVDAQ